MPDHAPHRISGGGTNSNTEQVPQDPQVLLEARDLYAPRVLSRDGTPLWEMYVASGFADRLYELPITKADLAVLRADEERYWFLFAALHHPYQLTKTCLSDADLARWCQVILHGSRSETETFLTRLDHGSANGAVSNLLRIFLGVDTARLRAGSWFGSLPARPA